MFNTLDYPSYSLAVERMKAAFRMAYSLFDKIAYFLNEYLRLGIPERNVSFRTLWYEDQQKKKGLKRSSTSSAIGRCVASSGSARTCTRMNPSFGRQLSQMHGR